MIRVYFQRVANQDAFYGSINELSRIFATRACQVINDMELKQLPWHELEVDSRVRFDQVIARQKADLGHGWWNGGVEMEVRMRGGCSP